MDSNLALLLHQKTCIEYFVNQLCKLNLNVFKLKTALHSKVSDSVVWAFRWSEEPPKSILLDDQLVQKTKVKLSRLRQNGVQGGLDAILFNDRQH